MLVRIKASEVIDAFPHPTEDRPLREGDVIDVVEIRSFGGGYGYHADRQVAGVMTVTAWTTLGFQAMPKGFAEPVPVASAVPGAVCTCSTRDLMTRGCTCKKGE